MHCSLIDIKRVRQLAGAGQCLIPGVSSQSSMMQSIESVIVGDGDISTGLQQH